MSNKKYLALLSLLYITTLPGCGTGEASIADDIADGDATPELRPMPVEVAAPFRTDIDEIYATTTTIGSDAEAPVLARVPGEVIEILVEEGDRVEAGQILARLDDERLRLQMLQAKATLDMTTGERDRFVRLHELGLVSASSYEDLKFDVEALTAAWELMRLNHGYTRIRAPISGVISSRDIKTGSHIEAGAQAFRINNTSRLVAYLHIPQIELARVDAGDAAVVEVDALPGYEFSATIDRISPTIDSRNGTFRATVYIDNRDGLLAPGMFSRFSIACESHSDALVVPSHAIVNEDDESSVYVIRDGAASRRAVRTGIQSGGITQILEGLDADDRVVVTGQTSLRDGSKVVASSGSDSGITG